MENRWIILFDGYCHLCSRTARFVRRFDKAGRFDLLPLQTPAGEAFTKVLIEQIPDSDSVILIKNDSVYTRSTAILQIIRYLRFPVCLMGGFVIVPRFIRDPFYKWIAVNRKRWFGTRETCYLP